jgi:hypothetical protein
MLVCCLTAFACSNGSDERDGEGSGTLDEEGSAELVVRRSMPDGPPAEEGMTMVVRVRDATGGLVFEEEVVPTGGPVISRTDLVAGRYALHVSQRACAENCGSGLRDAESHACSTDFTVGADAAEFVAVVDLDGCELRTP